MTLQLLQLAGVSANVMWVTWPGMQNFCVPELGWLQFSVGRQLSPNFYDFGRGQRGQISSF